MLDNLLANFKDLGYLLSKGHNKNMLFVTRVNTNMLGIVKRLLLAILYAVLNRIFSSHIANIFGIYPSFPPETCIEFADPILMRTKY